MIGTPSCGLPLSSLCRCLRSILVSFGSLFMEINLNFTSLCHFRNAFILEQFLFELFKRYFLSVLFDPFDQVLNVLIVHEKEISSLLILMCYSFLFLNMFFLVLNSLLYLKNELVKFSNLFVLELFSFICGK